MRILFVFAQRYKAAGRFSASLAHQEEIRWQSVPPVPEIAAITLPNHHILTYVCLHIEARPAVAHHDCGGVGFFLHTHQFAKDHPGAHGLSGDF